MFVVLKLVKTIATQFWAMKRKNMNRITINVIAIIKRKNTSCGFQPHVERCVYHMEYWRMFGWLDKAKIWSRIGRGAHRRLNATHSLGKNLMSVRLLVNVNTFYTDCCSVSILTTWKGEIIRKILVIFTLTYALHVWVLCVCMQSINKTRGKVHQEGFSLTQFAWAAALFFFVPAV